MKVKNGYSGFGVPAAPSRNCVRSARFLVDAQLNCESPGGVALGSLSDDEPSQVMPDYVIDLHYGDMFDVDSLYTPAAVGHEPVSLSARRPRSRSPRIRRRSIKELLQSPPSIDSSADVGSDADMFCRGAVPSRCSFCGHRARQQPSEISLLQARPRGRGAGSRTGLTAAQS